MPDGDVVHTVYVEMKNKHNTMNSASAGKTYIKMQNQFLSNDDCACFFGRGNCPEITEYKVGNYGRWKACFP